MPLIAVFMYANPVSVKVLEWWVVIYFPGRFDSVILESFGMLRQRSLHSH